MNKVPRWVFRYVGNKTFDFSSKKRVFCPKTTKFGPKLAFLVNLGQAVQAYSVPCWWVGWWLWRAGCISQDTCLLYILHLCTYMYNLFHGRRTGPTLRSTTALAACLASFPPTPAVWPGFVICLYLCDFSFDTTNLITN